MNDIETAEVINRDFKIPIVFMTGNSDPSTQRAAMATKPIHIFEKPIDDSAFKTEFQTIAAKIEQKKGQKEWFQ